MNLVLKGRRRRGKAQGDTWQTFKGGTKSGMRRLRLCLFQLWSHSLLLLDFFLISPLAFVVVKFPRPSFFSFLLFFFFPHFVVYVSHVQLAAVCMCLARPVSVATFCRHFFFSFELIFSMPPPPLILLL
jgi:hypothetical protein